MTDHAIDVTFCDDIRMEIGGKVSLMGCYGDIMQVQSMPAKIRVHAHLRILGRFENDTLFRTTLLKNDEEVISFDWQIREIEYKNDDPGTIGGGFPFELEVAEPCKLALRVTINDQEYICPQTLMVTTMPEAAHQPERPTA